MKKVKFEVVAPDGKTFPMVKYNEQQVESINVFWEKQYARMVLADGKARDFTTSEGVKIVISLA